MPTIFRGILAGQQALSLLRSLFSLMAHFPCRRAGLQLSLPAYSAQSPDRNRTPLSPENLPYKHTPNTHSLTLPVRAVASASSGSKVEIARLSLSFSLSFSLSICLSLSSPTLTVDRGEDWRLACQSSSTPTTPLHAPSRERER